MGMGLQGFNAKPDGPPLEVDQLALDNADPMLLFS